MLIFEPIPVEWIEKLQSIKSKYLKETIGGKHWYIDQDKQFSIYPIDWHTTVSTNIDGKYYSEGEYIVVFISGGKFVMISAYLTAPYNNWNEKNRLSNCLETVSEEDVKATILHCYNNFNKDIRNYEQMLDRKKFPFTFEPVAEEWREKLQSEEHALRGYEIIGGNYWYVDHVKQFAIYPVSWISTFIVRCDDGQEYYDFVIIYKERYYKCSADIFYIHKGWNEKNRMKLSLDLKDIEEEIKNAIICCSKHFYYDKKTYENT